MVSIFKRGEKMKKSKKRIFLFGTCIFTLIGSQYVYAKIIPGIDEPFDPPNYYSETSISWADTNNPSYFYRDLGWQGQRVKDVTRIAKSILETQNTLNRLNVLIEEIRLKFINMTGLSVEKSKENLNDLKVILSGTNEIYNKSMIPTPDSQNIFRTTETSNDPRKSFNQEQQKIWLNNVYLSILQGSKNNLNDAVLRADALNKALKNSAEAVGELSANQSNTEVVALYNAEIQRRNSLISSYMSLEAIYDIQQRDQELKAAEDSRNMMTLRVSDPYNSDKTDIKNYERPEGLGFVKFK